MLPSSQYCDKSLEQHFRDSGGLVSIHNEAMLYCSSYNVIKVCPEAS